MRIIFKEGMGSLTYADLKNMVVAVHWNSHRNMYSIVQMKSKRTLGKVIGYAYDIALIDCYTLIIKSKQKNAVDKGMKERHAFICGRIESFLPFKLDRTIYYNPLKVDSFVDKEKYESGDYDYLQKLDAVAMSYQNGKPLVTYYNYIRFGEKSA